MVILQSRIVENVIGAIVIIIGLLSVFLGRDPYFYFIYLVLGVYFTIRTFFPNDRNKVYRYLFPVIAVSMFYLSYSHLF
ncbi:hypothetical protein [Metabacillus iocasae]|uniref:Membrane protein n=1 Tax=Priestia iocasae TaxID=2291674 RepID=A0ABS2QWU1_9BACI|nr:hypothetical protein [Metabacillus iocasae]MBM7703462.1 putative membrane protein [Metabacillus iocasae]